MLMIIWPAVIIAWEKLKNSKRREESAKLLEDAEEKAWQYYQVGYELFSWGEKKKLFKHWKKR